MGKLANARTAVILTVSEDQYAKDNSKSGSKSLRFKVTY